MIAAHCSWVILHTRWRDAIRLWCNNCKCNRFIAMNHIGCIRISHSVYNFDIIKITCFNSCWLSKNGNNCFVIFGMFHDIVRSTVFSVDLAVFKDTRMISKSCCCFESVYKFYIYHHHHHYHQIRDFKIKIRLKLNHLFFHFVYWISRNLRTNTNRMLCNNPLHSPHNRHPF